MQVSGGSEAEPECQFYVTDRLFFIDLSAAYTYNTVHIISSVFHWRDPVKTAVAMLTAVPNSFYDESAKPAAEITELSSYIYAATCRLLVPIREFDEKKYWGLPGLCS
jgi:hypothetical protein